MISRFISFLAVGGLIFTSACSGGGSGSSLSTLPGTTTQSHVVGDHLKCFSVPSGTCSTSDNVATLAINSNGFNSGVTNAGVTIAGAKAIKGLTVSQLTSLIFNFTGPTNVGGDPRFNIPVTGGTLFIDANACFSGSGPQYTLDAINNPSCNIQTPTNSAAGYPNWAALVAAEPNLLITGAAYILIDEPGSWTIQNVSVQ